MIYVGIDWADEHHDISIVNEAGEKISKFRFKNDYEGFSKLLFKIRSLENDKEKVAISIETTNGLLVEYLLDSGYTIYPVNPMAADRARDRYKVTGVKDDKLDAWTLANFLRTDIAILRPIKPSSEHMRKLKVMVTDRKNLGTAYARIQNKLITCLKSYYPVAAGLFSHSTEIFLYFIMQYPTPKKASRITRNRLEKFLKKNGYSAPYKIDAIWAKLSKSMLPAEDWLVESKSEYALTLVKQMFLLKKQLRNYDKKISALMSAHTDYKIFKSLPVGGEILISQLMVNFGDNRELFPSYKSIQRQSGTAPITKQSGTYRVVRFRRACSHPFRNALHNFTFATINNSLWAKRYYNEKRAKGLTHSHALRCLSNIWVKIIYKLWTERELYDENKRLSHMKKQELSQPFIAIA
jgi:hypothetical protein